MKYMSVSSERSHLIQLDQKRYLRKLSCLNKLISSLHSDLDFLEDCIKCHRDECDEIRELSLAFDYRQTYNELRVLLDDCIRTHKYLEIYQIQSGLLTLKQTVEHNLIFQKYFTKTND